MIRNEYRRAFIMLRAVMPGYGGHVRLERRTLTGSMYFIITAPQGVGELAAALVGQQDGAYYAAPIGPLCRDRRGQLALAWQFDPRSIEGRPLEAYSWVAIVATGGPCALALTGNVEGSRTMDLRAVEETACALFTPAQAASEAPAASGAPAADLPEPEPTPDAAEPIGDETRGDVRIYTMTRARLRRRAAESDSRPGPEIAEAPAEPAPDGEAPQQAPAGGNPAPEAIALPPITEPARSDAPPMQNPAPEAEAAPRPEPVTAARLLGLDITVPWPGVAEDLRRLFATQRPAADAPRDGFTYVRAPMPAGSGYRESYAGLRAADGRITGIRYALPGRRAPEPPPGLEGYRWLPGDGETGFWVTDDLDNSDVAQTLPL